MEAQIISTNVEWIFSPNYLMLLCGSNLCLLCWGIFSSINPMVTISFGPRFCFCTLLVFVQQHYVPLQFPTHYTLHTLHCTTRSYCTALYYQLLLHCNAGVMEVRTEFRPLQKLWHIITILQGTPWQGMAWVALHNTSQYTAYRIPHTLTAEHGNPRTTAPSGDSLLQ